MNKNIVIVLVGGFLISILVALIVQSSLSGKKEAEVAEIKKIEILVAAKDLKTGHEIKSGDLKWQSWPEETVFVGALIRDGDQSPTDVAQGKLLRPLVEGQPVHMTLLSQQDQGDFLSANVQKGMRAVGISVKSHVISDRLFRPGDFVDVMLTYRVRINSRENPDAQSLVNRYATETVIENVRILAIDKEDTKAVDEAEEEGKKTKKKVGKRATVTVEVTPENAEKLMLADAMGELGIMLRSIGDNSMPESDRTTTDVGMSSVLGQLSAMRGTSSGVRIYNGIELQDVRARSTIPTGSGSNFNVESSSESLEGNMPGVTVTFSPGAMEEIMEMEE